jgi:hypothetical protein
MHEAMPALPAGHGECQLARAEGDASPLEGGDHRPAHLIDLRLPPGAIPVADPAHAFGARPLDDLEDTGLRALIASLALGDLRRALWTTEMVHHRRVSDDLLE